MGNVYNLLGAPEILEGNSPSELMKSAKGVGLVAYLIINQQTQPRETVADLLWEANTTTQSLKNLRSLLTPHPTLCARIVGHPPILAISTSY